MFVDVLRAVLSPHAVKTIKKIKKKNVGHEVRMSRFYRRQEVASNTNDFTAPILTRNPSYSAPLP